MNGWHGVVSAGPGREAAGRRSAGRALMAAVLLSATVAACGESGTRVIGDDPVIIVHSNEGGQLMSLGTNTVEYDPATKCLILRSDSPDPELLTPVWPRGVKPVLDEGRRGVDVRGVGRFLEGDTITLGGVVSNPEGEARTDIHIPCRDHAFAIINPS